MYNLIRDDAFYICIALFLLLPARGLAAVNDSILWSEIKRLQPLYLEGHKDSVIARARELLPIAEQHEDHAAQLALHSTIGISLSNPKAVAQEYIKCVEIAECHGMMAKARKTQSSFLFTTMLNVYSQLALYCDDLNMREESVMFAKSGMEWMSLCEDSHIRSQFVLGFAMALMKYKEYTVIYEPMKQAIQDALKMKKTDQGLMLAAYLATIEYDGFGNAPADIPWIEIGDQLLDHAKTYQAKSTFQNARLLVMQGKPAPEDVAQEPQNAIEPSDSTYEAKTGLVGNDTLMPENSPRIEYVTTYSKTAVIISGVLATVILVFVVYILWYRWQRKKREQEAEQMIEKSYIEGQESERSRLAKELHDGISNQLLAVEMKLNENGVSPNTLRLLSESREQVRRMSHELIPPEFNNLTIKEILADYVAEINGVQNTEVTFMPSPEDASWSQLSDRASFEIYRITQEIVGNILKHAEATTISIGLHQRGTEVLLIISDNGKPMAEKEGITGIGLRTIQQRTSSIKGELTYSHHPYGNVTQLLVPSN